MIQGKKVDGMKWAKHDIELWKGHSYNEVMEAVLPVKFFDGAVYSIRELAFTYNFDCYILSGTFDAYMKAVLKEINKSHFKDKFITDWNCVRIETDDNNIITGIVDDQRLVDKGVGIEAMAEEWGFHLSRTIAIGNGSNDLPMFKKAGFSIAFNPYNKKVREAVDVTIMSDDFFDVVRYMRGYDDEY